MKNTHPLFSQHHYQKTTIACGASKTKDIPSLLAYHFWSESIYICQILDLSGRSLFLSSELKLSTVRITVFLLARLLYCAFNLLALKKTMHFYCHLTGQSEQWAGCNDRYIFEFLIPQTVSLSLLLAF